MKKNKKYEMIVVVLVLILIVLKFFVIDFIKVSGVSMEDTIKDKDIVFIRKIGLNIKQNDIVVAKVGTGVIKQNYIKRVVGVPHDTIQIIDGKIYINDVLWESDPMKEIYIEDAGMASEKITLDDDEYFIMGDNRNESYDSRFEKIGVINIKQIQGIVIGK